ncbi:hypothetical protein QTP88_022000 [Uroleucon formosanum]
MGSEDCCPFKFCIETYVFSFVSMDRPYYNGIQEILSKNVSAAIVNVVTCQHGKNDFHVSSTFLKTTSNRLRYFEGYPGTGCSSIASRLGFRTIRNGFYENCGLVNSGNCSKDF